MPAQAIGELRRQVSGSAIHAMECSPIMLPSVSVTSAA